MIIDSMKNVCSCPMAGNMQLVLIKTLKDWKKREKFILKNKNFPIKI